MMRRLPLICALSAGLSGCAMSKQQQAVDLTSAYNIAAAGEAAYAAAPGADPLRTAEAKRLLAAAQAALVTWFNATPPTDSTPVASAIAALVAYEATLPVPPASSLTANH